MSALDPDACWQRLRASRHGVLSTMHPERGVDAVPVVYAVVDDGVVLPIDRVKPKRTTRLQRLDNVARDPRCVLLVDHYEDDWRRLWWVRVHGAAEVLGAEGEGEARRVLEARFEPYRTPEALAAVMLLRPSRVRGWQAT